MTFIDYISLAHWPIVIVLTAAALLGASLAFVFSGPRHVTSRPARTWSASALLIAVATTLLALAIIVSALPSPTLPAFDGVVIGVLALALSIVGGGPATLLTLRLATRNSTVAGPHGGIFVIDPAVPAAAPTAGSTPNPVAPSAIGPHEILRGGTTIGILERLAVTGGIIVGFPETLAVVIAVKGVGRFTELTTAEAKERFIIGTLSSLVWACACAALVRIALLHVL